MLGGLICMWVLFFVVLVLFNYGAHRNDRED